MQQSLSVRFSFLCRTTRTNNGGKHPLVLRIIYNKERRDIFTGLYCAKEEWNSKAGRLLRLNKTCSAINDNLDIIQRKAFEVFDALKYAMDSFTIDELVSKLKGEGERPLLLMDYLEEEKERIKKRVGVDITPATSDKYRRSASHVQNFLQTEYKVKNYPLARIDVTFLEKYFQHLRGTRGVSHNVAVKYITFLKTVLMPALRDGLLKDDPFRKIKLRQKTVHKDFLSNEELTLLTGVELTADLNRIRDIFLFSCYTGLAYADIKQLARLHIVKDSEESYYIRKPRL